jgi:hypothetical protein
VQPAGSGCDLQLDPHFLSVTFDARDGRADGGVRHIEINRDRVLVRRAVSGIRMAIAVRVNEFLGIARRATDEGQALVIAHRDPSLSIPLLVTSDGEQIEQAWQMWSDLLALPQIDEENNVAHEPAPRRRRHNAIRARRPKFLVRRKAGHYLAQPLVHSDEREIIARN